MMAEMTERKKKSRNGFLFLIIPLMILAIAFGFKKNSDFNELEQIFISEKTELQDELDELLEDYKGVTTKNKSLSERLKREIGKIASLRDSVKELAGDNYSFILKYRKKVHTLERENHDLFVAVDSLNLVNRELLNENIVVVEELKEKKEEAEELKTANEALKTYKKKLEGKVRVASLIKTSAIDVFAMKERSSGKLTKTSRSRKTDAFKTNFQLLENKLRSRGKVKVYVQVSDQKGRTLSQKGKVKLRGGRKVAYSDELIANYKNKPVNILSLVLVNREDINKGTYNVTVYVDGKTTGKSSITLR